MTQRGGVWVLVAIALAVAGCGPRAEADRAADVAAAGKTADCAVAAPELFRDRTVKWEGECSGGSADGLGALRAYPKTGSADTSVLIFFGRLEKGAPKLGVIETPDGYIAGEFEGGKALDTSDRNVVIKAFRVAAEAATFVSKRFKAAGNSASAAFYEERAKRLDQQMD